MSESEERESDHSLDDLISREKSGSPAPLRKGIECGLTTKSARYWTQNREEREIDDNVVRRMSRRKEQYRVAEDEPLMQQFQDARKTFSPPYRHSSGSDEEFVPDPGPAPPRHAVIDLDQDDDEDFEPDLEPEKEQKEEQPEKSPPTTLRDSSDEEPPKKRRKILESSSEDEPLKVPDAALPPDQKDSLKIVLQPPDGPEDEPAVLQPPPEPPSPRLPSPPSPKKPQEQKPVASKEASPKPADKTAPAPSEKPGEEATGQDTSADFRNCVDHIILNLLKRSKEGLSLTELQEAVVPVDAPRAEALKELVKQGVESLKNSFLAYTNDDKFFAL